MIRHNSDGRDYIFTLRIDLLLTIVVAFSLGDIAPTGAQRPGIDS